ncbi:hypothetical protein OV203_21205 [Nannocystis sp. ILAH1]|uniref:hypothetical protein n=1 Tax=Nannocystis sp. ILAH1 TaxID=2996789 RepID=UPI00226EC177|nr:hypothetical protein [Nannocystis sp. ILAH1]MCY0989670.1 hypothetical protein [Nannocystis sp. ILAH1]
MRPPGPALDGPPGTISVSLAGMYHPPSRSLWIDAGAESFEFIVAHEGVHFLQDMHFGLDRFLAPIAGDSDAELARTLLVEGDANAACIAWESGERDLASTSPETLRERGVQVLDAEEEAFDDPVLGCIHMLPYNYAPSTIVELVHERGWTAIDALYRDPPATSEQMLHPAKLSAREPAIPIAAHPERLAGALPRHTSVRQDTLGEARLFCMLAAVVPSERASAAAAGWGGDRIVVLETSDSRDLAPLVLGLIAWDGPDEAAEFEPVFRQYLEEKLPGRYQLERRGRDVLFATQVPTDAPATLLAHAWNVFVIPS